MAALPPGVRGHWGAELRRFILLQHHQGQVTVERLTAQLRAVGISISKRQVMRLLIDGQDDFLAENRDVLRAGLRTAAWITVDDTGARHARQNGFCDGLYTDTNRRFPGLGMVLLTGNEVSGRTGGCKPPRITGATGIAMMWRACSKRSARR